MLWEVCTTTFTPSIAQQSRRESLSHSCRDRAATHILVLPARLYRLSMIFFSQPCQSASRSRPTSAVNSHVPVHVIPHSHSNHHMTIMTCPIHRERIYDQVCRHGYGNVYGYGYPSGIPRKSCNCHDTTGELTNTLCKRRHLRVSFLPVPRCLLPCLLPFQATASLRVSPYLPTHMY